MRIGIDARLYSQSGLGRYIRNLIAQLKRIDIKNEYFIFLTSQDFADFEETFNFKKVLANYQWYGVWEQLKFPRLLKSYNLDLVHFPHFNVPILYRDPFVVTIHDLIHQHYATRQSSTRNLFLRQIKKIGYSKAFGYAISKSKKIFVPSSFVKLQLEIEWKVDSEKIIVSLEAVDDQLIEMANKISSHQIKQTLKKFNINNPFLFYLGNAQPHKNLTRLINVFKQIKQQKPELSLVLSGPDSFFWQTIKKEAEKIEGIIFTGFITDEEMVALYKSTASFVMPSVEEGFGIPILEAMACGCAVVCAKAGSLIEVGGKAADYFIPWDEVNMRYHILKVLDSSSLRKELIKRGLERYKEFSWKKMAQQTLEFYNQVL